jgi:yersiniabactin nonribosomal peptide synthetase
METTRFDLGDAELADVVAREPDAARRCELLTGAVLSFLVRAGAVGAEADAETPALLESLVAVALNGTLQAVLGVELGLVGLREPVCARELAERVVPLLDGAAAPDRGAGLVHDAAGRFEPFPLTDLQQAYLLGRGGYFALGNVPAAFYAEFDGSDVDVAALEEAWRQVVARHDMLRTVFTTDGRQQLLAHVPVYHFARQDLSGHRPAQAQQELAAVRERLAARVRPPETWPLFDIAVSQLDGGRQRVHVAIDMLIADGPGVRRLLAEWLAAAAGHDLGPAPGVTFRDYVQAAPAGAGQGEAYAKAREYWTGRMAELPPAPQLPLATSLETLGTARFATRSTELTAEQWTRLRQRALRGGFTPSMVLCWAFAATLRTWSASDAFTLNVTVNERAPLHPDIDEVVGVFTSHVLVEFAADPADVVRRQLADFQDRFWKDFEHRAFSGVQVLRELARAGDGTRTTMPYVFDAVLGQDLDEESLPGWFEGLSYVSATAPQVALECQVFELQGALRANWAVVEELFPPGLIDSAFAGFRRLLGRLADDETLWDTRSLGLVGRAELRAREEANATAAPPPAALLHELGGPLRARGSAPAVITPGRTVSYAELDGRAARIARRLRELGAHPNTLVGVVMNKGWEQVVAAVGVLQAGAAYLPLDAGWPADRIHRVLERGRCGAVLTQARLVDRFTWPEGTTVLAVDDDGAWAGIDDSPLPPVAGPHDLAYTIFTSGSTGEPKGVMIDHLGAANTVADINGRYRVTAVDRVLGLSALSFDLSVYDVFGPLAAGAALVLPRPEDRRDPAAWLELVRAHRVTVWNTVPALMEMLVEHAEADGQHADPLRLVLLSGDWIPLPLPGRIRACAPGAQVVSLGGATEASIWSVHHPVGEVDPSWRSIPYGRPLANQTLHILDSALEPVPTWVPGDLYIGGTGLAHGYWDDPRTTARSFPVHPVTGRRLYRTGDLGRYHPDGTVEFLGRTDHQVKINGHRIELGEIEAHLVAHPAVSGAVVTAAGNQLTAYLTPANGVVSGDLITEARRALRAALPDYMVPRAFLVLNTLPLTANGKVDRAKLPAPQRGRATAADDVPARNLREERLAAVWCAVLGRTEVGVHTDFFRAGGDSLLAVRVAATATAQGLALTAADVFAHPTIAAQAEVLARGSGGAEALPEIAPDPAGRFEPFPLTDLQQAYLLGRSDAFALGNVPAAFYAEIDAVDLDAAALERAWQRVVARHDALRTVCTADGQQRVLREVPAWHLPQEDLRGRELPLADQELAAIRDRLRSRVFRPGSWPLFDIAVTRLDDRRSRIHLSIDLLLADGATLGRLVHEWQAFYRNPNAQLPVAEVSFRDYVRALDGIAGTEPYEQARAYWTDRLPELPPAPRLPLTTDPERLESAHFTTRTTYLTPDQWARLRRRALGSGLTPSMVLCWAYAAVLRAWSATDAFTLNLTLSERLPLHPDIDRVAGAFTSVTLLAVETGLEAPVREQAHALQRQFWADFARRSFNGVRVLRELARTRGWATASMPVVFTSALGDGEASLGRAAREFGELAYTVTQTPQVHLECQVFELDGALRANWAVLEELFPPGLIDAAFAAFGQLLERLADDEAAWDGPAAELVVPGPEASGVWAGVWEPTPLPPAGAGHTRERPPEPAAGDAPPRNDTERQLCGIWAAVLNVETVGIHDEFVDMGGDSLLALRVISRAREAGIRITPRQFFANPTVAEMAAVATLGAPAAPAGPEATEITGDVPLLPAQAILLSGLSGSDPAVAHHHNYALFFELDAPMDKVALRAALRALVARHDALRTGFVHGPDGWRQHVAAPEAVEAVPLEWIELGGLLPGELDGAVEELAERAQRGFDLEVPPLLRLLYFDLGPARRPELLLVAHWLALDNFSLRVLVDELLAAHAQFADAGQASLPPASLPASVCARRLAEQSAGAAPGGTGAAQAYGVAGDARTLIEVVDAATTARLRERAHGAATVGDVLLAALARAAGAAGFGAPLRVDVDGHGRDETLGDVSRTVGRLSVRHTLEVTATMDSAEAVQAVADARSAAQSAGAPAAGAAGPPAPFAFNYLGSVDELYAIPGLRPATHRPGPLLHPGTPLHHRFDVLCGTVEGELLIGLTFPGGQETEARRLLDRFTAELANGTGGAPSRAETGRRARGSALAEMFRGWLAPDPG